MNILKRAINPKTDGISINSVSYTANKNILIKMDSPQDLIKLRNNEALINEGFQFDSPGNENPRIIIFNIEPGTSKDDLTKEIYENNDFTDNPTLEQFRDLFIPLFPIKITTGNNREHWIVETDPNIRKQIQGNQWRIKTLWNRHRAEDFLDATRCFRCQQYGHPAKYCSSKDNICGHCGQCGHKYTECNNKNSDAVCPHAERPTSPTSTPSILNPVPATSKLPGKESVTPHTRRKSINVLQINMARSQLASYELTQLVNSENTDILIIQEPYAISNISIRPATTAKLISANGPDEYPWATIIVLNSNLRITNIRQAGNEYLAVAHVESDNDEFYIASVYMRQMEDVGETLSKLDKLTELTLGKNLIIGGDTNATSITWGASATNSRGEAVEEFIAQHGFAIINGLDQPSTFSTIRASSYIDVTLAKGEIKNRIKNWSVKEHRTSSDHNAITYTIIPYTTPRVTTLQMTNPSRFNTRRINTRTLHTALTSHIPHLTGLPLNTSEEIEVASCEIERVMRLVCNRTIPKRCQRKTQVKWWTPRLTTQEELLPPPQEGSIHHQ